MTNSPILPESAQALRRPARRFSPLMAAALALCMGFFLVCAAVTAPKKGEEPPAAAPEAARFTQLAPEAAGDVTALTITRGSERFTLSVEDGVYALSGGDAELDPLAAKALLQSGASILSRQTLEGDPAAYGVGGDALRAEYRYESGAALTLLLGDAVPTGEGYYAAAEGQAGVHVVNNALASALTAPVQTLYALPDLAERFTANTMLSAEIALPGQAPLTLARVTQENPFNTRVEMTTPIRYPANPERAAQVYLALEGIRITGVAGALPAQEETLAVITLRDKGVTEMTLARAGDVHTLRIAGDDGVYTVDGAALSFLQDISVPYLAEQLPGLVMLSKVSGFTVRAGEETLTFTADQSTDTYTLDGKPVAREDFLPAYQQMIGLLIERYVPQAEEPGAPRIAITYNLHGGESWEIAFAPYDEQFDLVVREGCACFLIAREKTDAMLAALRSLK